MHLERLDALDTRPPAMAIAQLLDQPYACAMPKMYGYTIWPAGKRHEGVEVVCIAPAYIDGERRVFPIVDEEPFTTPRDTPYKLDLEWESGEDER